MASFGEQAIDQSKELLTTRSETLEGHRGQKTGINSGAEEEGPRMETGAKEQISGNIEAEGHCNLLY